MIFRLGSVASTKIPFTPANSAAAMQSVTIVPSARAFCKPCRKIVPRTTCGVSILHNIAIDTLLKPQAGPDGVRCAYVHQVREVLDDLASDQGSDLAVLVPPASMEMVQQIAGGGEKMPPKSTYFYPKILSGLVFNPLK